MSIDLNQYRSNPREVERIARLFELVPANGRRALDIGARDGYLSQVLAERFDRVVALDLQKPDIHHPHIECVQGNATALPFEDASFDAVLCAEVLEHIPARHLSKVGQEIVRVTAGCAVIGVPFRQDLRVACTTCASCGGTNPPWGHVNSFDERRLTELLLGLRPVQIDYVGRTRSATNALSAALMGYAGNPFGTYDQDEACIHCSASLGTPKDRNLLEKLATRAAHWINLVQAEMTPQRANWMHIRFDKLAPANRCEFRTCHAVTGWLGAGGHEP